LDPIASPWECLYLSQNNPAMITATGFDYASFSQLEVLFTPFFDNYSPYSEDGYIR